MDGDQDLNFQDLVLSPWETPSKLNGRACVQLCSLWNWLPACWYGEIPRPLEVTEIVGLIHCYVSRGNVACFIYNLCNRFIKYTYICIYLCICIYFNYMPKRASNLVFSSSIDFSPRNTTSNTILRIWLKLTILYPCHWNPLKSHMPATVFYTSLENWED